MLVVSVTNTSEQLRGYLTHYLFELRSGLFIGDVSARVRDGLRKRLQASDAGSVLIVYNSDTEQGFAFEYLNANTETIDLDGLLLPISKTKEDGVPTSNPPERTHWSKAYWCRKMRK